MGVAGYTTCREERAAERVNRAAVEFRSAGMALVNT
jgi:hypothetical protein